MQPNAVGPRFLLPLYLSSTTDQYLSPVCQFSFEFHQKEKETGKYLTVL